MSDKEKKESIPNPSLPEKSSPQPIDAPDDPTLSRKHMVSEGVEQAMGVYQIGNRRFRLVRNRRSGEVFAVFEGNGNPYAVAINSQEFWNIILAGHARRGVFLNSRDIAEIVQRFNALAFVEGAEIDIFYRVAPIVNGIEIDLGDKDHTHIQITPGNVKLLYSDSETVFHRTSFCSPMPLPASEGNINLLKKYLNVSATDALLLIAFISYTLAHSKVPESKYLILVIQGDQGTGKSFLVLKFILSLIDPTKLGLQVFPRSSKDLSLALCNTHVLAFDNMRNFNASTSDLLCIACTGGSTSTRKLYTDRELNLQPLHGAVILNGIHPVVNHSDLAQRSLPIHTLPIPESKRRSESEIVAEFNRELPVIFRGLLDLISNIFLHLDDAKITHPERMIDFVKWLAAMEKVDDVDPGTYQSLYSSALNKAQLDSLLENSLASAVIQFIEGSPIWTGTPTALLELLERETTGSTRYDRDWPKSPIALSKRLNALKASLLGQGIKIEFHRGKQRKITVTNMEAF